MSITYTFPQNFNIAPLRGLTATGGEWTTVVVAGRRVDAVAFANRIGGKQLIATVAGKPELEQLLAAHRADEGTRQAAAAEAAAAYAQTLAGQREALAMAEYNTYSPENFPGSAKWRANKRAADALAVFDAAHPEIAAAKEADRQAAQKAKYDALSDFVKMGS
jgi:hypothetical protein